MTPIFCCGFECGVVGAAGQHWLVNSGTNAFSTSTVRTGARSYRINPTAATSSLSPNTTIFSSTNKLVVRFYIRFTTLPSVTTQLFDNSNTGVLFKASDSSIYAGLITGTTGATGVAVSTGQWYRIDLSIDSSNNPHLTDVQVDGVACGQHSNSSAIYTYGPASVRLGNGLTAATQDTFYDDVIMSVTLADYPIGEGKVISYVANADGTHTSTSTNITKGTIATPVGTAITSATTDAFNWVNGRPILGGATDNTRLINQQTASSAQYVEVAFEDSAEDRAPRSVEVLTADREASTATCNFITKLNDNGTESDVINRGTVAGVTTDRYATKQFAAPPTGGSWNLNASGAGSFQNIKARFGYSSDATPDVYWRGIIIEAEYDTATIVTPSFVPRMLLMGVG